MPETYKGLTVPQYSDTADGVDAIRNLVDSGPIARVDDEQLGEIAESSPEVGTVVYYAPQNVVLQWCGPTMTWKPLWANPWGHIDHWESNASSQHSSTYTTVNGFASIDWTAYANRNYRITVTGVLHWNDTGTSQGTPGWTVDGSTARASIQLKQQSDDSTIVQVYNGRASLMYGDDYDLFSTTWIINDLDGEQTWKLVARTENNVSTDDFEFTVGTGAATMVLIEDIGPSGAPT